ncbi:hypothetical protein HY469_02165 [Candidatus Roizmanbacteria bacterium]|nr:hypothetical protein [Candidatus Roizmanbacteria bacterium]
MSSQPVEIIPGPGVIQDDFTLLRKRARMVSSLVEWIQIDIADSRLVPNSTSLDCKKYKEALEGIDVRLELHMMVADPLKNINGWIEAGFKRILLHIESFQKIKSSKDQVIKSITAIQSKGAEVGLAVDKDTSIEVIYPYLDIIDCVLVMTIKAGFSGQKFIPELLEKVKAVHARKPDLPIEVDGGITGQTAPLAIAAGVTRLVSTSFIYDAADIGKAISMLKHGVV